MNFFQGGVTLEGGTDAVIKTKKALKEAVAADPERVRFRDTSHPPMRSSFPVNTLEEGSCLTIVGPDPATNRKWYANIMRDSSGNLKVT